MKTESIFEMVYRVKPETRSERVQFVKAYTMMHAARIIMNRHSPAKVAFKKVKATVHLDKLGQVCQIVS